MFVPLILFLMISPLESAPPPAEDSNSLEARLDAAIKLVFQVSEQPGFALAVVSPDKVFYKKAFGVGNMHTQRPLNSKSLFHMASVTKTFVATALMKLTEQGRMDLDKPVVAYLPYFTLIDDRYNQITVRQMLSHVSGMPDFDSNPWHDPAYDEGALERFVRDFVSLKFMTANPGEKFQYSNTAFEVLGDVIAKASGMSFEDYVHESILKPLGMKHSTLLLREADRGLLASPHVLDDRYPDEEKLKVSDIWPYNRMHGPSSTLYSCLDDMIPYIRMYLNKGSYGGQTILREESIDAILAPGMGKMDRIGMAWFRSKADDGTRVYYHSGGDVGFVAYVFIIPEKNVGFTFMANGRLVPTRKFAKDFTNMILAPGALN